MRILSPFKSAIIVFSLCLSSLCINAQNKDINIIQDAKFEQLLSEKRKINSLNSTNNTYRIQIFSGKSEEAKTTLYDFKKEFKTIDATIIFNTPNYKVIVGNFKNRIDAERNLVNIRQKYSNVFLIKPGR